MSKTIKECLATLNVSADELSAAAGALKAEFAVIKAAFRAQILIHHPDKGGTAAAFRQVRASFEVLKDLYSKNAVTTFCVANQQPSGEDLGRSFAHYEGQPVPSYDFFAQAAAEEVPEYRIEKAKSGRSKCAQKSKTYRKCEDLIIEKDAIRIGSLNKETGSYGRWHHLSCWRVPSKVWLGFPEDKNAGKEEYAAVLRSLDFMLLSGFEELPESDQDAVLEHCMKKENWAKLVKPKTVEITAVALELNEKEETAVVRFGHNSERETFVIPEPGKDGAIPNALAEKVFVITGTFPEIGGGCGLDLGKARVKAMIEAFGGRVVSAISGKTTHLIVGKEPGVNKVAAARQRDTVQLLDLKSLKEQGIEVGRLENAAPVVIEKFSEGYSKATKRVAGAAPRKNAPKKRDPSKKGKDPKPSGTEKSSKKRGPDDQENEVKPSAPKKAYKTSVTSDQENESGPPAPQKRKKKRATKNKTGIKKTKFKVTCDGCAVDCTAKSWFVPQDETDWCEACVKNDNSSVLQINGVAVL